MSILTMEHISYSYEDGTKALKDIRYKGDFTFEADNFLSHVPDGFMETALKYMHDCGRYLISMIEE